MCRALHKLLAFIFRNPKQNSRLLAFLKISKLLWCIVILLQLVRLLKPQIFEKHLQPDHRQAIRCVRIESSDFLILGVQIGSF